MTDKIYLKMEAKIEHILFAYKAGGISIVEASQQVLDLFPVVEQSEQLKFKELKKQLEDIKGALPLMIKLGAIDQSAYKTLNEALDEALQQFSVMGRSEHLKCDGCFKELKEGTCYCEDCYIKHGELQ